MKNVATQFCPAVLCEAAGHDAALVDELLDLFLRTVPPMLERLVQAIDARRPAVVAHEAHGLKGCLALVGAADAGAACARMESAARRSGACPGTAAGARLRRQVAQAVEEAARYRSDHQPHP